MKSTFDGVRREAERRRMLQGDRVKIRDLNEADFVSYESLQQATQVDFKESDNLILSMGLPKESLALLAERQT
jgi:hypothetical protein